MIEYIGIDIGGTNIRVGGIDKKNNLVSFNIEKTLDKVKSSQDLYDKIKRMVENITEYDKIKGIGVAFPGAIDENDNITTARNVGYFKQFPLVQRLREDFGVKVEIANDARIAAYAESKIGEGKEYHSVCYITISTGLGGGMIIDNNIYYGARNLGGYFSRMILDGENIAEELISGTALVKNANKISKINIDTPQELFSLAKNNKELEKVVNKFKNNLVNLLLNISVTLSPEIIILGGGVMKSKKFFLKDVKNEFVKRAHEFAKDTKIVESKLKEPGLIGAALYVKNK